MSSNLHSAVSNAVCRVVLWPHTWVLPVTWSRPAHMVEYLLHRSLGKEVGHHIVLDVRKKACHVLTSVSAAIH